MPVLQSSHNVLLNFVQFPGIPVELFLTPVGHRIAAALGETLLFRAIRKHGPDFGSATFFALEYDVPPIRRPGREILPSLVMGKLGPTLAGNVHDVDVLPPGRTGAVLA